MAFEDLSLDDAPTLATDAAAMAALQQLSAERMQHAQGQPMLVEPAYLVSDCTCRGGRWIGGNTGYCLPANNPTGKYFDMTTKGCLPIPGFVPGAKTSWCQWRGVNVCLWGGVLVGSLLVLYYLKKKKGKGVQSEAATH